jgi:putative (di)nucleoside polyphosphate hydrolase
MQKWYLLKLVGKDTEIDLNATGHAEFDNWKWGNKETAITSVIKFKRDVYKSIFREFKDVLDGFVDN